jgi:hypothetical protein
LDLSVAPVTSFHLFANIFLGVSNVFDKKYFSKNTIIREKILTNSLFSTHRLSNTKSDELPIQPTWIIAKYLTN